jgi:hypothetical protein
MLAVRRVVEDDSGSLAPTLRWTLAITDIRKQFILSHMVEFFV